LTLLLVSIAGRSTSAHRRDEYLQAARVAIDPDRVDMVLDLTPGIAVAENVLADIDLDGNKTISPREAGAYSARVLSGVALDVDGTPLRLELIDSAFPAIEAVLKGEGTTRIHAAARLPALAAGPHHLHFRNMNRADVGVYLANAMVPASDRVAVTGQQRDFDQRDLVVDYVLRADPTIRTSRWLSSGMIAVLLWIAALRRRR